MTLKEEVDFYQEFEDWYQKILNAFKFDYDKDCIARDTLARILEELPQYINLHLILNDFKSMIEKTSNILIYGCGPTLEETINEIHLDEYNPPYYEIINLAADGAAIFLREKKIFLHGLFTDLDGITKEEFMYTDFMIVHAHGDNIDKLNYYKQDIIRCENVIGTTQCEPLKNIINPGGFTDGDRALFFLRSFLTDQRVFLIGMDFNDIIGRYSKPKMETQKKANPIKLKKLEFAVELLEWLIPQLRSEVYFVNCKKSSNKFNYISIEEYKEMVK